MLSNKNIRTIVFDFDGVIANTDEYHYDAWYRTFKEIFDFEIDRSIIELIRGESRIRSLELILEKFQLENVTQNQMFEALSKKTSYYVENTESVNSDDLYEGIEEVLEFLRKSEVSVILASSSRNALLLLTKINFVKYFDNVVDVTMIEKLKPDPEIFFEASKIGHTFPEDCIAVEDSQVGIDSAKKAGMFVVAFNFEGRDLKNFDIEVRSHSELLQIAKDYYK